MTDPTETPGRINYYENIKDVTGNTPPVPTDDAVGTAALTPVQIDVLANDVDAEADDIIITGLDAGHPRRLGYCSNEPVWGLPLIALLYTPPVGVGGGAEDTFIYSVADGSCSVSVNADVTISID